MHQQATLPTKTICGSLVIDQHKVVVYNQKRISYLLKKLSLSQIIRRECNVEVLPETLILTHEYPLI